MGKAKLICIDATGGQTYGSKYHVSALINYYCSNNYDFDLHVYVKENYLDFQTINTIGLRIIVLPILKIKIFRILFTTLLLPILCNLKKVDLLYCPFDIGPVIKIKTKVVLGIKNPNIILPKELVTLKFSKLHSFITRYASLNVDLFLYPSNYALQAIGLRLSNGIEKGLFVYHGLDFSDWETSRSTEIDVTRNYILFCSNIYKFKNLEVVIKALHVVVKEFNVDLDLIVIGDFVDKNYEVKIKSEVFKLNLNNNVYFFNNLSRNKVIDYYRHCKMIVIPTKFETFGHMYLEAKMSLKPTIVADIPVAREILKNSVLYFNCDEYYDLAVKVAEVIKIGDVVSNLYRKEFDFSQFKIQHECEKTYNAFLKLLK
jgi:glycosyltransferase involved in cell wall biosynthesis